MSKIEFLDLGKQPITNNFLDTKNPKEEFMYKLKVTFDEQAKMVSLGEFVPPEKMFNENYAHRASMSKTMQKAYKELSNSIKKKFNPNSILEIGSNDGVFLKNFSENIVIGVEPCKNLADITNSMKIKTFPEFWTLKLSDKIIKEYGNFDFIYSANTISHIHNLEETFLAIEKTLGNKGIFVLEDPSLIEVIKNGSYDQFYDEHAYVFSLTSIIKILEKTSLEVFDIEKLSTHGGSNRIFIKKKRNNLKISNKVFKFLNEEKVYGIENIDVYLKFGEKVQKSKHELISIFKNIKKNNKKIIGYGATYKSATVLNYCGLKSNFIDYFIDTTITKQGKFTPGTHIPIIKPDETLKDDVDYAFLGAWNFKEEILEKEKKFIERGGKFITHVPFPNIL
tara:strand:- start:6986 stop:8167 length:1182 start_codon:yes stop_codon:yes gene_type:complete